MVWLLRSCVCPIQYNLQPGWPTSAAVHSHGEEYQGLLHLLEVGQSPIQWPAQKFTLNVTLNKPISWSSILLQQLTAVQLLKKLPAWYDTWKHITMFTGHINPHNFWSFHSNIIEDSILLWCDTMLMGKWLLIFQRNVRNHFPSDSTSHPRQPESSHEPMLHSPHIFKIHVNIIITSTSSSLKWNLPFKFPIYNSVLLTSLMATTCPAYFILHGSFFDPLS